MKSGGFAVGEKDIAEPERIENHLKNLSLTGTLLSCTVGGQRFSFKVNQVSRSVDSLVLTAMAGLPPLGVDDIATFVYFSGHEPYRFGQRVVALEADRGVLRLHFPLIVRSNERRAARRFTFPKREEIHTVIITELTGGTGVSGPLHDLASGGGALTAEKMVLIPSGKEIRLSGESLKPGPVRLIKFRLPAGLEIETSGLLVHTAPEPPAFRVGFRFDPLPARAAAGLKMFLEGKFR